MADAKKATDGPEPNSSVAFDFTLLPDFDNDFVNEDDFAEFAKALAAPEISPSTDDLTAPAAETRTYFTALNDWRPIHQRVRRRKKSKAPSGRGKDETREGFVYVLLKWPLLVVVLGWLLFLSIAYVFTRLYIYLYEHWITWRGTRQKLRKRLENATSYEDWIRGAKEIDTYLGNDSWKETPEYSYYDSKTLKKVHEQIVKLRQRAESDENGRSGAKTGEGQHKAVEDLRALMEACVKNNFVGFENPRLWSETYYGTKELVQSFVDEAEKALTFLLRTTQLDADNKRALFKHLGSNFGRTALCLSGGATFAYYHFGVAKALLDADLLPEVITGTSGGALVAALLCTRTDEELKKLLVPALAHRITACSDDMFTWIKRWYTTGARFDSVEWAKKCAWMTRGSMTFREAYQRTGRILNVSCVPSDPHSPTILANYITAPDCVVWSAVLASAAVPGILNPVVLMKKNKDGTLSPYSFGHKWKDGSLRTDIPLKALNLHFNVRFSIVSQVNPHINIFFFSSRGSVGRPVTHRRGRGWRGGFIGSATEQYLKLDLNKWLKVLRHLELLPRPLGQDWSEIWLQRFSGTITIWPKSIPSDFVHILADPTPQRLARMIHVGQQSAFPKLKFIANRAKLENIIQQGRRQYRPRGTRDGDLVNIFSEDDLRGLLKRTKSNGPEDGAPFPMSGSESSSSSAGLSRPGSPVTLPLGFNFGRKNKRQLANLKTNPSDKPSEVPDSPSLTKRLSGWWSAISPQATADSTALDTSRTHLRPTAHRQDRPNSMFEFRPPKELSDLYKESAGPSQIGSRNPRKQSRVFVDDDSDNEDHAQHSSRHEQHEAGVFGDEDSGEAAEFGDDESDGEEVQSGGVGL
ncbi:lipid particle protein [Cucurbitaria berberidis CBS 394.84]|uniref:Patatin-like phospholipase domain-containing protein n=1 Tax=Cucurbitaria berberidis CBS 394.84 TaxID=1168544 RepID=A0A9P4GAS6_9PLEO|nr:lipid particle protein [Cucurbitaria berberidis CBS 394.84]KAF1841839.1 lipid particle protein [Cucurbitaria berberidis CBS 394.84]